MHSVFKIHPTGASTKLMEPGTLGDQQGYRRWFDAARSYGDFLQASEPDSSSNRPSVSGAVRVAAIRIDHAETATFDDTLRTAYRELQSGDILIVDVPNSTATRNELGSKRDVVGRALFAAGFDCPMIWAGRKVLEAENRHALINRLLPSSALGAGPRIVAGVGGPLDVEALQVIAIARRGFLAPPNERPLRLSVVMPVYNEKPTFRDVMELLLAKVIPGFEIEICIIESNSTDGSRDDVMLYANHPRVRVLLEDAPSGKGHAVRSGLKLASGDIVLIQDADLEYDLADYEKLLDPIRKLETSFVLGSRHPVGEKTWQIREFGDRRSVSDVMNLGHLFFTWFFNLVFRQRLRDPFTMYKVFRRDCIHNVRFECDRFDFDHELVGKLVRNGFSPREIDVHYRSRSFDDGKKVAFFRDPPTWIKACTKHRFSKLFIWPESD